MQHNEWQVQLAIGDGARNPYETLAEILRLEGEWIRSHGTATTPENHDFWMDYLWMRLCTDVRCTTARNSEDEGITLS